MATMIVMDTTIRAIGQLNADVTLIRCGPLRAATAMFTIIHDTASGTRKFE